MAIGLGFASTLKAEEVSFVQGFYKSNEVDGGTESQQISLGGRYGLDPKDDVYWFAQGSLTQTSYSGPNAPDGGLGISLGGGQRYIMPRFSSRFVPYFSWLAEFRNTKAGQTETNGIFYSGQAGLRLLYSPKFFVDLEATIFSSALTSTEETSNGAGGQTKTTKTELFIDSFGSINDMVVSMGMKL
jgi:hypothetical protein